MDSYEALYSELDLQSRTVVRLIAAVSTELIFSKDCDKKISLGYHIGFLGRALSKIEALRVRISVTFKAHATSAVSQKQIDQYAKYRPTPVADIEEPLAESLEALSKEISAIHRKLQLPPFHYVFVTAQAELLQIIDDIGSAIEIETREGLIPVGRLDESKPVTGEQLKLPIFPGRPNWLRPSKGDFLDQSPSELIASEKGRARLLMFFFIDIEIAAAEVCAGNILLYPNMPNDFIADMCRQIWDECRHAELARDRFVASGGTFENQEYTGVVWRRWALSRALHEKLAIEQIIQEGNGIDASLPLAELFRGAGDNISAAMIEFFMSDEVLHSFFGNKWLLFLTDGDTDEYAAVVNMVSSMMGVQIPGGAPVHRIARRNAGFPEGFLPTDSA